MGSVVSGLDAAWRKRAGEASSTARAGETAYGEHVSPISPSSHMAGALAPAKVRRDGIRLGLVAVLSIVYALVLDQTVVDVLLIVLNGFGVLVAGLALVVSAATFRRHGRAALVALAVYGACLAGHVAALVLLLG